MQVVYARCAGVDVVTRQKNCYLSSQFHRLAARRGVKRAVMAVAHSMLVIGYHMLKTGQSYRELGGNYLEQINKGQLSALFHETTTKTRAEPDRHSSHGSLSSHFRRR